jgi:hypothetical protein
MSQSQQLADCYQDLFNHLAQEYDLRLTESELDEVVKLSLATVQKIDALAEDSIGNVCREIGEMSDEEFEQNCKAIDEMTNEKYRVTLNHQSNVEIDQQLLNQYSTAPNQ